MNHLNSFNSEDTLTLGGTTYHYYSLNKLAQTGLSSVDQLPKTLKILLENLLRWEDGVRIKKDDIKTLANWAIKPTASNVLFSRTSIDARFYWRPCYC